MPEDTNINTNILDKLDLKELWDKDGLELIKKLYPGEVGES